MAGAQFGKVRALLDDHGKKVDQEAGPSIPVEVLGLDGAPSAGDTFLVVADERTAKEVRPSVRAGLSGSGWPSLRRRGASRSSRSLSRDSGRNGQGAECHR
ncbi:MAG: hypothetical protein MPW15_15810 [Candidatus Manganitrophus sp.]|nr:hypothetical protein [Candidatus Manganitrophus sp.]